jgi:Raf kinase inhibitor-like YbhB/YbcL family protein
MPDACLIFPKVRFSAMKLISSSFDNRGLIPKKFTCDSEDIAPVLVWSDVPERTKSFALVVDDPDALNPANPRETWVHLILYNIPPGANSLPAGVKASHFPKRTLEGLNDLKKEGDGDPCPLHWGTSLFSQALCAGYCTARPYATNKGKTC